MEAILRHRQDSVSPRRFRALPGDLEADFEQLSEAVGLSDAFS